MKTKTKEKVYAERQHNYKTKKKRFSKSPRFRTDHRQEKEQKKKA